MRFIEELKRDCLTLNRWPAGTPALPGYSETRGRTGLRAGHQKYKKIQFDAIRKDTSGANMNEQFEPKIIAFACNWCSYAGADLAGVSRLQYPPSIRLIRLMCSGMLVPSYILKAFEKGADGVLVTG